MNTKKTKIVSFALPRNVYETFQNIAKKQNASASKLLQDWIAHITGMPCNQEPTSEKINHILQMESVYPETQGTYPSRRFLYEAFRTGRVLYKKNGSILVYSIRKKSCYCFVPRR